MKKIIIPALFIIVYSGCKESSEYRKITSDPFTYNSTVYQLNEVLMSDNFTPPLTARAYAYANIAGYECIAAGYPERFQTLAGQVNGLTKLPVPPQGNKIDYEFAATLAFAKVGVAMCYSEYSMKDYIENLKKKVIENGMKSSMLDATEKFASEISDAVIKWSKSDHFRETRKVRYVLKDIPGSWKPTPPHYAPAVEPAFNKIRPMVLDSASQFTPTPPYTFDVRDKNSPYYKEVIKIMDARDSLSDDQKHMADFWDDNPVRINTFGHLFAASKKFSPPGHWMGVAGIAAKTVHADFSTNVCACTKTAIALLDAFIQCWDEKYRSCTARPVTVINDYFNGAWSPYLQTPPFPEYTCGHSTISAAAAEALTSVLGDNVSYTDTTELAFGIASRSFHSFRHAAEENIWGRFYGGIHYHYSCIEANRCGRMVGELVVKKLEMEKMK